MGCVPLQLPLSRWARLWLTLLVGHLVITSKRSVAHRRGKRRNDVTAEQLLSEISDYCRRVGMAESTFGRHAVNDGKLVSRLRIGGGPSPGTPGAWRPFYLEDTTSSNHGC